VRGSSSKKPGLQPKYIYCVNEGYGHHNYGSGSRATGSKSNPDVYTYQPINKVFKGGYIPYPNSKDSVYNGHKDINTYINDVYAAPSHSKMGSKDVYSPHKDRVEEKIDSKGHTYTQHYPLPVSQFTEVPGSDGKATYNGAKDIFHNPNIHNPIQHADKHYYEDNHGDIYAYNKRKLCEKVCANTADL
jgi:hypothetical protein